MQDVVTEYRELLTANESVSSLDSAVALVLRAACGESGTGKKWHPVLTPQSLPKPWQLHLPISTAHRAKNVAWLLTQLPPRIEKHIDDIPADQYSFLMDTLLIVFHQALFGFLPSANGHRESLLLTLETFSDLLPRQADQSQTRGLVQMERGRFAAAIDSFRTALAATHADDHDFITRVQMAWTVLMERRQFKNAFDLLIDVYPRTSRADLMEVQEMLRETFLEVSSRQRGAKARA